MPRLKSGLLCPVCLASGVEQDVFSEAGAGGARMICATGNLSHAWTDMVVFRGLNPQKAKVAPKADTVQRDHEAVSLMVPKSVKAALEARFGDKLSTSLTSVLSACAEPEMMILNSADLQRLQDRLGSKPKGSGELFGMIFQLGEAQKEARNDVERLTRQMGVKRGGTGITVDLGDQLSIGVAKAGDAGVDLEEYLGKYLRDSLENGWVV